MFTAASPSIPSFGDQAYKRPVANATTAALPANTRVGNTLTANAVGAIPLIDGVGNTPGDRILVKNEATGANNGIYVLVSAGDATHPWSMVRSPDTDTAAEAVQGAMVYVIQGTLNGKLTFVATAAWTLNVTNPTFLAVQVKPGDPATAVSVAPAGAAAFMVLGQAGSAEPIIRTRITGDAGTRMDLGGGSVGLQLSDGTATGVARLRYTGTNQLQLDDGGTGLNVGLVGKPPVVNVYNANATWTKPANIDHIVVECVGGGGQGGGSAATAAGRAAAGGGGGGGGYARATHRQGILAGATYAVVVGAGGSTGGAGAIGQAGGDSTFAGTGILTTTGKGGAGGPAGAAFAGSGIGAGGGTGGAGLNADLNAQGGDGAPSIVIAGVGVSGGGGSSAVGGGGQGTAQAVGVAGHQYGGGGGGAETQAAAGPARAGGAGGAGVVIVTEYYGP